MRFTSQGWHDDDGKSPYMLITSAPDGGCRYSIILKEPPRTDKCCLGSRIEKEMSAPTLAETLMLVLNVSLGQRKTTPASKSKFIDRISKTFFQETSRIDYSLRQDNITNLSALANYIQVRRLDDGFGALEALTEEYFFIIGNIAYSLADAACRLREKKTSTEDEMKVSGLSKKHALREMSCSEEDLLAIADAVLNKERACAIIEGAMISCAVSDHVAIAKDRSNVRLRRTLSCFDDAKSQLDEKMRDDGKTLEVSADILDALAALAACAPDKFYVVCTGTDDIEDYLVYCGEKNLPCPAVDNNRIARALKRSERVRCNHRGKHSNSNTGTGAGEGIDNTGASKEELQ